MNLDELPFDQIKSHFLGARAKHPTLLGVTPPHYKKACLVGSCMLEAMQKIIDCEYDFVLFNGGVLPPVETKAYDLLILQIPLRSIIHDHEVFTLAYHDTEASTGLLELFKKRLTQYAHNCFALDPQNKIPFFVLNFMVPVNNPNGTLLPKYSENNIQYMVEQLNQHLEMLCFSVGAKHLVNIDDIANSYGKLFFSDERTGWYSHGGVAPFYIEGLNGTRLEQTPHTVDHFQLMSVGLLMEAVLNDIRAKLKILQGRDTIKLVVVDLDDTLWKGVVGDTELGGGRGVDELQPGELFMMIEGWPMGVVEALQYFKKRGGLLAINSRNSEEKVRKFFPAIFKNQISLSDFAVIKINFNSKVDNMQEILTATNLLPDNVLFIDDNPVERAKVHATFPKIRIIGKYFQYIRSLLLFSPELQVPIISEVSSVRTQMVQQQIIRESEMKSSDSQEFLHSIDLEIDFYEITNVESDHRMGRAVELINKTNQWNSTGEKVDDAILRGFLKNGGRLFGATVKDKFTHYGDVAFIMLLNQVVVQFVMSCRIAGLTAELFFLHKIFSLGDTEQLFIRFIDTGKNAPFRYFIAPYQAIDQGVLVVKGDFPNLSYIREPAR
jgi:FkbH-like protein